MMYYNEFSRLRALCKREAKSNYTLYIKKLQSNFTHNPKSFWNYIKSQKKENNIPTEMEYNYIRKNNGPDIANLF